MKTLKINGVTIDVVTAEEAEQLGISDQCYQLTKHLFIGNTITKTDLFDIAGYGRHSYDFALPQEWVRRTGNNPGDYVWWYSKGRSIFGEPLSINTVKAEVAAEIIDALIRWLRSVTFSEQYLDAHYPGWKDMLVQDKAVEQ